MDMDFTTVSTKKRGHAALGDSTSQEDAIPTKAPYLKKDKKKKTSTDTQGTKSNPANKLDHFDKVDPNLLYNKVSCAPFIVFIKYKAGLKDTPKMSNLECARKLVKCNVNFTSADPHGYNLWKITFPNKSAANDAIRNKFLRESGFTAFISKYKISRKGVIHQIPLDIPMEEILLLCNEENPKVKIQEAYRLKRKNKKTNSWEESETICITFQGEKLPDHITLYRMNIRVQAYIPAVRICFKCGRIGHISKFCDKVKVCLSCGTAHLKEGEESKSCTNTKACINCKRNHSSIDSSCPELLKRKEINKIMAIENIPYLEAKRKIEGNNNITNLQVNRINFPPMKGTQDSTFSSYAKTLKPASQQPSSGNTHHQLLDKEILNLIRDMDPATLSILKEISTWIHKDKDQDKLLDRIRQLVHVHCNLAQKAKDSSANLSCKLINTTVV